VKLLAAEKESIRYFHSYRSLFRINYKIHELGGKVLPRAIPLDTLIIVTAIYFPCWPLGWLISHEHPWIMTLIVSGVAAWIISQADPQGKFLPVFVRDFTEYLFRPKMTNLAGRPIMRMRRQRLDWTAMEVGQPPPAEAGGLRASG
jgi:hypothetical protein